ncbi:hypothetical protein DFH09DRAFT_1106254 [Mycena vulgaris]|nr:hypothetical protein DFH09DRAFT_1106254 [Mycena vulgaris]
METPWEPHASRGEVEEFLSLLADVPHLTLVVHNNAWCSAAWKSEMDVPISAPTRTTFDPGITEEATLAELIELTGNLPLAVVLMARVASFEGYLGAASRWRSENMALLSEGYDKRSNLGISIAMSLTSPRFKSTPHALDLLSLLSLLPERITEAELISIKVPILEVPRCKSSLLQTSLAFLVNGRLKALPPIRDYIRGAHPASNDLTGLLLIHFQGLLKVSDSYHALSTHDPLPQLTSHLANIQSLFLNELTRDAVHTDIEDVEALRLASHGIQYFAETRHYEAQATVYITISIYKRRLGKPQEALEFSKLAMDLTNIIGPRGQLRALHEIASIEVTLGMYPQSILHSQEAQRLARLAGMLREECWSVGEEARPWCRLGNFARAQECAAKGHDLVVQSGLQSSDQELQCLDRKADIHFEKSEYAEAPQLKNHMMQMTGPYRSPYYHANALQELAQIDIITGADDTVIIENLTAAEELSKTLGWTDQTKKIGERVEAYTALKNLLKVGNTKAHTYTASLVLQNLVELSNEMCGLNETCRWVATYLAWARKTKSLSHTYQALRYLGDTLISQGDEHTALSIFQAVLDGSTEMDVHRHRADYTHKGKDMWEAARPLFIRSSRANDTAAIDTKLANLVRTSIPPQVSGIEGPQSIDSITSTIFPAQQVLAAEATEPLKEFGDDQTSSTQSPRTGVTDT